jgi:hypothetical protein
VNIANIYAQNNINMNYHNQNNANSSKLPNYHTHYHTKEYVDMDIQNISLNNLKMDFNYLKNKDKIKKRRG